MPRPPSWPDGRTVSASAIAWQPAADGGGQRKGPCFSAILPTVLVAGLFFVEGSIYNAIFVRRVLGAVDKEGCKFPFALVFNFLLGLALASYMQARYADPGVVPQEWQEFVGESGDSLTIAQPMFEWQPGKATFCRQCGVPRPERAHHCKICGMCVLRMDHHCPWLGTCVGFKNHKYFILSVLYALLTCVAGVVTALPELAECFDAVAGRQESPRLGRRRPLWMVDVYALMVFGTLGFLIAVLLAAMLWGHLTLAMHNVTSIEGHFNNMPNPFDQGEALSNLAQLFGEPGIDWLLPVPPWRPLTDGISFDRPRDGEAALGGLWSSTDSLGKEAWRVRYSVRAPAPFGAELEGCGAPPGCMPGRSISAAEDAVPLMQSPREVFLHGGGAGGGSARGGGMQDPWERRLVVSL